MVGIESRLEAMMKTAASRQEVLKQIWETQGPDALFKILEREPAARENGIAEELRREAAELALYQSSAVERLVEMAEAIEGFREAVDRFARVETLADLLEAYNARPLCHGSNFNRLVGAFWLDALRDGDTTRAANLRRAMKVLSNVYAAIQEIATSGRLKPENWARRIVASNILGDTQFHEFIDSRAHFLATQKNPHAETFVKLGASIRTCSRVAPSLVQIKDRDNGASIEGPIKVPIPVSPDRAELWFLVSRDFGNLAKKLSDDVASGSRTIRSCMDEAAQYAARNPSPRQLDAEDDEETIEAFLASAFLEHLLRFSKPPVIVGALEAYARLSETGHWSTAEKRGIFVLHYTKAVLSYWHYVKTPLALLKRSAELIQETLGTVDENTPRLFRDLWVTRARLLENVGFWEPEAYSESLEAYGRALSVAKVKHEAEARGRALTDCANTMSRLRSVNDEDHDKKIMATYQEALTTFEMEKSVIGRTLALDSFAIYLNERLHGERSANQERALSLVQQAIDLLEQDERADHENNLVGRTLASAYLTKSNILRRRGIGDEIEAIKAALDSLHMAQDRLGKNTADNQLRGIISINLGQLNIELHEMTRDVTNARNAMYAYQEAETILEFFPSEYSQALLGTAMLVSEIDEEQTPEAIEESIAKAEQALHLLQETEDLQARARAYLCVGELHSLRALADDFQAALDSYKAAMADFLEAKRYDHAIVMSQRLAGLWIQRFMHEGNPSNVREAEKTLQQAIGWIEIVWAQVDSVQWRFEVSDRFSNVYAEIAWCQATLGEAPEVIAFALARSKGREFMSHSAESRRSLQMEGGLGEFMDQLRVESREAERSRWEAAKRSRLDVDVNEAVQTSRQKLMDIELRRRLLFPPPSDESDQPPLGSVEAFLKIHPKSLILDFTVSRWGTVVLLAGGRETGPFAGYSIEALFVPSTAVSVWVDRWSSAYFEYLKAPELERDDARVRWAKQTEALLMELSQNLMQPCLRQELSPGMELIIVAGRLAGLPFHAATLMDGRYAAEAFDSVTYCPNISVLSPDILSWQKPSSPMFVVSDREGDLISAARECQLAIETIGSKGAGVKIFAQVGPVVGRAAFSARGIKLAADIDVNESAPTPERLAEFLPGADHFFYSGHGARRADQSGLVVADNNGEPTMFSENDILSMHVLRGRPIVVLSACETAMGGHGSSELFDTASSFLRVGARFVVGSLWLVTEDCATKFTAAFYEALASGEAPSKALGSAVRATRKYRSTVVSSRSIPAGHPIYWAPFMAIRGS
jgi:tetratricopeptide (TPR) repeat protein